MLVLGYCVGLRIGEIVGLELRDIDMQNATIEVRDTKFFKSRLVPIGEQLSGALADYLCMRTGVYQASCFRRRVLARFCVPDR